MVKRRGAGDFGVCAPDGKSGEIRGRRPVRERRMREEGEGADMRARGRSERGGAGLTGGPAQSAGDRSEVRASGPCGAGWQVGLSGLLRAGACDTVESS